VQFWFQNRRQRDSRALKASQLAPSSAESQQGGTSTSNADAILEQLRMMNQARNSIHSAAPAVPAHLYTAGQPTPGVYMPNQMSMQTAAVVQMQQMGAQMYPSHLHAHPSLAHYPPQLPLALPQQHMFSHPGLIAPTQQNTLSSHQGLAPQPPAATAATLRQQQFMAQQMHQMHQMHQMQQIQPYAHVPVAAAAAGHMQHQAPAFAPTSAYAPNTVYASSPYMDQHQMGLLPPPYYHPSMQAAANTDDVAAATMMGLCHSHESSHEAVIEDDVPAE